MADVLSSASTSLQTRPVTGLPAPAELDPTPPGGRDFELSYYWYLLFRRRWLIVTFTLVVTVAITLLSLALPKKYSSSVLIRVDPQGRTVVGDQNSQNGGGDDATLLVSTEAQVITSPAVISELIQKLDLANNPEFRLSGYHGGALTELQRDQLDQKVAKAIGVGQPIGTLLLQISFTSHDPQLSSLAANALSQVYLEHEYATRAQSLSDASKNMRDELDGLRAKMEQSQSELVDYESSHNVIDPDNQNNIYQASLSQINEALSTAVASRIKLQAEYTIAESGGIDALAATPSGDALKPLRTQLEADRRELGHLATIYGPKHPLYVQQNKVVQFDQRMLEQDAVHITRRIGSQFASAVEREQLLRRALNGEKTAMNAFNMRAIKYHSLKAASDSATALYYSLQKSIQDSTVAAGLHSEELRITSPAKPNPVPIFPRPFLYGVLAFFGSLGLAITGVIVTGLMDKSLSTPEEVERRLRCRVLATLPDTKMPLRTIEPAQYGVSAAGADASLVEMKQHSPYEEAILELHSALRFSSDGGLRALSVTSSVPGEGKSTLACHLAAAFAGMGTRTVLVDADLRKPNVHRIYRLPNRHGLSNLLRQQEPLAAVLQTVGTNLSILPAGPVPLNPGELLHLEFPAVMEQLRSRFDFVLVDCPPALGLVDATIAASLSDGYLMIATAGKTTQDLVTACLRQMTGVRANLLGLVLNRVHEQIDHYYSYYRGYHTYYQAESGNEDTFDEEA